MLIKKYLKEHSVRKRIAFLAKDTLFYGLLASVAKLSAFLSFPIYARFFSKEEFAVIDIISVVEYLLIVLIIFGQDSGLARFFYDVETENERRHLFTTSILSQLLLASLLCVIFYYTFPLFIYIYNLPEKVNPILIPLLWKAVGAVLLANCINVAKWLYLKNIFVILSLGSVVVIVLCSVGAIYFLNITVTQLLYLQATLMCVFALWGLYLCKAMLSVPSFDQKFYEMLMYSLPFGLIYLCSSLLPSIERAFVTNYLGLETLAVYAVAIKMASIFRLVSQAFQSAWGPFSMLILQEENAKKTFDIILLLYSAAAGILILGITWISPYVLSFLAGNEYAASAEYVVFIMISLAIQSLGLITGLGSTIAKKSMHHLYSHLGNLCVALLIMYSMTNSLGIWGVLAGLILGAIVQLASMTFFSVYSQSFRLNMKRPMIVFIGGCALSLVLNYVPLICQSVSITFVTGLLFMTFYTYVVWFTVINEEERQRAYTLCRKQ